VTFLMMSGQQVQILAMTSSLLKLMLFWTGVLVHSEFFSWGLSVQGGPEVGCNFVKLFLDFLQ
jgi:hypothetical protein